MLIWIRNPDYRGEYRGEAAGRGGRTHEPVQDAGQQHLAAGPAEEGGAGLQHGHPAPTHRSAGISQHQIHNMIFFAN